MRNEGSEGAWLSAAALLVVLLGLGLEALRPGLGVNTAFLLGAIVGGMFCIVIYG